MENENRKNGKRLFVQAMSVLLLLLMVSLNKSCERHYHINMQRKVVDISVQGREWLTVQNWMTAYHYYVSELPELTEEIFRGGRIRVYLLEGNRRISLPSAQVAIAGGAFFTEYIQYHIRLGVGGEPSTITFWLVASDLSLHAIHPPGKDFRVVLEW